MEISFLRHIFGFYIVILLSLVTKFLS